MKCVCFITEAVVYRSSSKSVFLKISQISLENICVGLNACNYIKKRFQHRCFPVKFPKLLRTPFFTEQLRWLLLSLHNLFPLERSMKNIGNDQTKRGSILRVYSTDKTGKETL